MSNNEDTFVAQCLAGNTFASEIDDFVEVWHNGSDPRDLSDFLGMTSEEYGLWVERPDALGLILCGRKHSLPLKAAVNEWSEGFTLAARASKDEAKEIVKWLKQTGRIPNDA